MPELVLNLHMHTTYSDGTGSHSDLARAALSAGLDAIIVTDHNVHVRGLEGYHQNGSRKLLMLIGEEVHDPYRQPPKNHLLIFGAGREMASYGSDPQNLIDQVRRAGGICFIAHPYDLELKAFHELDFSWVDWQVHGYHGLELWNGMSEIKAVSKSVLHAVFYAFFPRFLPHGPLPQTLAKWDELLSAKNSRVTVVGGSDAHALHMHAGPLRRTLFPYEYHFKAINNHLLVDSDLTGDLIADRQMILNALRAGHNFVGYDLPHDTRGFRFTAQGKEATASMGDEILLGDGVTLQVRLPLATECRLLRNGERIKTWTSQEYCTHLATQPGVYRVEVYIDYLGKKRGWIFSNPIYIREAAPQPEVKEA
ncbi:MAG: CehA/McbA family metallohydrolase [Anaerolineaceae bacterium]|nr:CehA/McbA family metallohydrolase [Anaerolineaceae bacterium]